MKVTEDFFTGPPDLLVIDTDPRIRIRIKMSRMWNTAYKYLIIC
jgi:hypothetical protein